MSRSTQRIFTTFACCSLLLSLPILFNLPFDIIEAYEDEDPDAPAVDVWAIGPDDHCKIEFCWDSQNVIEDSVKVSGAVGGSSPSDCVTIDAEPGKSYTATITATGLGGSQCSDSVSVSVPDDEPPPCLDYYQDWQKAQKAEEEAEAVRDQAKAEMETLKEGYQEAGDEWRKLHGQCIKCRDTHQRWTWEVACDPAYCNPAVKAGKKYEKKKKEYKEARSDYKKAKQDLRWKKYYSEEAEDAYKECEGLKPPRPYPFS